jgi:hypothetical protein
VHPRCGVDPGACRLTVLPVRETLHREDVSAMHLVVPLLLVDGVVRVFGQASVTAGVPAK